MPLIAALLLGVLIGASLEALGGGGSILAVPAHVEDEIIRNLSPS